MFGNNWNWKCNSLTRMSEDWLVGRFFKILAVLMLLTEKIDRYIISSQLLNCINEFFGRLCSRQDRRSNVIIMLTTIWKFSYDNYIIGNSLFLLFLSILLNKHFVFRRDVRKLRQKRNHRNNKTLTNT